MAGGGQFVYDALDPSGNTIRLLTLLPGQFSDKVYLSLTHESFQDKKRTPYESLSYTWGESQTPEKVYIWQNSPANVSNVSNVNSLQFLHPRTNLLTALKYIRLPNTPRVIWVDAICIDQDNITERNQQVARMGQIYSYAAQVLVWLGPEDESTSMALETIERLSAGILLTEDHRNCKTITGSEAEVAECRFEESKFTPQHWTSLNQLIRRPWFERLWIRQEVQLASKVLVRCGYAKIEWGKIEKVIIFVEQKVRRVYFRVQDILKCRSLFHYIGSNRYVYVPQGTILSNLSLILYTDEEFSTVKAFLSKDANKTLALFPLKFFLGGYETQIAPVNCVTSTPIELY
ncbi:MAG: hypothetical protein LQ342_005675 [Letrouitia transgressa]|nr:MAG: hypothetical protein LQ342_005675 [Letrouitia transgressa]